MCGGPSTHRYEVMTEVELENEILANGALQSFKDYLILSLELDKSEVDNLFMSHS